MKLYRTQFIECSNQGLTNEKAFYSFEEHPEMVPAFPNELMKTQMANGDLTGFDLTVCGRFGGVCSAFNPECVEYRKINPIV